MTNFEIENCINSIVILVDTREQNTERARRRYNAFPCPHERKALDFGDYSYKFSVSGSEKYLDSLCAIERKMNLDELAGCFTHDRDRFKREFQRSSRAGANMLLIIENASMEHLLNHKYKSRFNPDAFIASLIAWSIRYDFRFVMCKEETTPRIIYEWCKRDLKERLERGDFDGK